MPTAVRTVMPRWVHALAVLTVVTALPLVLLGAEVTTRSVGMADPAGYRDPRYLWQSLGSLLGHFGVAGPWPGLAVEHAHRFVGMVVGVCCILLAAATLLAVRHPWGRWVGCLALFMVSAQGILGIFRVDLNALRGTELALFHGLFAQLVLAVLVGVAVLTAPAWWRGCDADVRSLRVPAALLSLLVYGQIVFGAVTRHLGAGWAQRLHVLFAFGVVAVVVWLVQAVRTGPGGRGPRVVLGLLCVLVLAQVSLGVEAWLRRFGTGDAVLGLTRDLKPTPTLNLVRSGHFVVGSALFVTTVVLNLLLYRPAAVGVAEPAAAPAAPVGAFAARMETVA